MCISSCPSSQRGITLVEQIVFIIVVSVGVVGLLSTLGPSLRFSADPQLKKQQLAIAESLLSEILHQPFTYCDPDDPAAISATSAADCAVSQDNLAGPSPADETRAGTQIGKVFDNIADYAGFNQTDITDVAGTFAMSGYTASVAIRPIGANYTYSGVALAGGAALEISVTVSAPGADPLTLTGYRFRYAPRY